YHALADGASLPARRASGPAALQADAYAPFSAEAEHDVAAAELSGQLLGDSTELLGRYASRMHVHGGVFPIACDRLQRADFAAAGSVLNWVVGLQAEGVQVQFNNLHRLVAIFFNIIGIGEYAQVIPRKD
ncbi:MAG TPA: hypothetical protein VGC24_07850, partial [Burkholderiaceae bacterium]